MNMENLCSINTIKDILKRYDFDFSKRLGQNFLINPSICPRIAEFGISGEGFGVIEIGTGIGTLTAELAKKAEKVVAFEVDGRLLPVLKETLADFDNIRVFNEDIMQADIGKVISEELSGLKIAVCANLPYYITSPVIMLLLESGLPLESITVMVQKEAAQRLCAKPGTRQSGAITLSVNYYGVPKHLFDVSRGSFCPSPNVDSSVIRIDIKKECELSPVNEEFFFRLVKASFSQRRKTLPNTVSSMLSISKETVASALCGIGLDASARAENLDLDMFINFSDMLYSLLNHN